MRKKIAHLHEFHAAIGWALGHKYAVLCLATVKNLVFSASADKTIQIWRQDLLGDFHSWLARLQGHSRAVKSIAAAVNISNSHGFPVYNGSTDRSVKVQLPLIYI